MTKKERQAILNKQAADEAAWAAYYPKMCEVMELVHNAQTLSHRDDGSLAETVQDCVIERMQDIRAIMSVRCRHFIHSIVFILSDIDCFEILKKMSDENIKILRDCLARAQKAEKPDYDDCLKRINSNTLDEAGIQSSEISMEISLAWDEVLPELDKWSKAIVSVQKARLKAQKAKATKAAKAAKAAKVESAPEADKSETWAMEQLAEKLGYDKDKKAKLAQDKCRLLEAHPELKDKVESWFVPAVSAKKRKTKLFKAEHFDEFAKLLKGSKNRKRKSTKSQKAQKGQRKEVVAKEPKAKKAKKATEEPVLKVEKVEGLAGLKILEKLLAGLQRQCAEKAKEYEEAEAHYKAESAKLKDANPETRAKLLKRIEQANDIVLQRLSELEALQKRKDEADKLLQDATSIQAQIEQFVQANASDNM